MARRTGRRPNSTDEPTTPGARAAIEVPAFATALPAGVPAPLAEIIDALRAASWSRRPGSAHEAARRLDALGGRALDPDGLVDGAGPFERARRVAVLPLRGRSAELEALCRALDTPGVHVVHGPPGAGRTRLAREAIRSVQRARAAQGAPVPTCYEGRVPVHLDHPALVLDEAGAMSPAGALAEARAAALEGRFLAIVLERDAPVPDAVTHVSVGPLEAAALSELLGDALGSTRPTAALTEAANAASGGLAGRLCRLLAGAFAEGRDPSRVDAMRRLGRERGAALVPDGAAVQLVEALAVAGGTLGAGAAQAYADAASLAHASGLLVSAGLASHGDEGLVLRPDRVAPVFRDLSAGHARTIARRLAGSESLGGLSRICVDAALGHLAQAAEGALAWARARRDAGEPERAADGLLRVLERLPSRPPALALALADALRAAGDDGPALEALADATGPETEALRAELARRRGDRDTLGRALAALDAVGSESVAVRMAWCVRARDEWTRGHLDAAEMTAARALEGPSPAPEVGARAHEVLGLVALARGRSDEARSHGARASRSAGAMTGAPGMAARGRAAFLEGSAALHEGRTDDARAAYAQAASLARGAGERAAEVGALTNLGLVALDAGRLADALEALRRSAAVLASQGPTVDRARTLANLAGVAMLLGDHPLAERASTAAGEDASRAQDAAALDHVLLLQSELDWRKGRPRAAVERLAGIDARSPVRVRADLRLGPLHAALGNALEARACLERARGLALGPPLGAELALAESMVALHEGHAAVAEGHAVRAMADARTFETRLQSVLLGADTADACGLHEEATARLQAARSLLETAADGLPSPGRATLRAVGAYQRAFSTRATDRHDTPEAPPASHVRGWTLARAIVAAATAREVLEALCTAVLERSGAERAFVFSRAPDGAFVVRAARGVDGPCDDVELPSRSIAARVLDEGRPMMSVDALVDTRLDGAASVHALSLRSVLAAPITGPSADRLGVYLDDRLRPDAFGATARDEVLALAAIAGSALSLLERARVARRAGHPRPRTPRAGGSSPERGPEDARPFERLVGQSPAMRRVRALASRFADSDAHVLLVGETGTGKDLLARALHDASGRRGGPFLTQHCAAIPEALLESALFGHVRGAFTGAEQARRGVFELARAGSLLLEGIEHLGPALQAKILRVLSEGTVRPVGADRDRALDVRVIAVAGDDLDARRDDGRLREDLYHRLAVLRLDLPPLRDRLEDLPALIEPRLARRPDAPPLRLSARALDALRAYSWPGNVRQLENEIARASLVARDCIDAEHLSADVRNSAPSASPAGLKAQVEALERRLVEEALVAHAGNQTRAARALGLSRFGLQKMLRRFERQGR